MDRGVQRFERRQIQSEMIATQMKKEGGWGTGKEGSYRNTVMQALQINISTEEKHHDAEKKH